MKIELPACIILLPCWCSMEDGSSVKPSKKRKRVDEENFVSCDQCDYRNRLKIY